MKLGTLPDDDTIPEMARMMKRVVPRIDLHEVRKLLGGGSQAVPSQAVQIDEIDAALASEFVDLLDESVAKISTYDDMPIRYPNARVQQYFDQAHRCYFYGLGPACAVLCRAILESALKERVDPHCRLRPSGGSSESHISKMIERATGKFLDQERAKCAEEVRDAGNKAIHDLPAFRSKYEQRMGQIVDNTRKIVIDLYT